MDDKHRADLLKNLKRAAVVLVVLIFLVALVAGGREGPLSKAIDDLAGFPDSLTPLLVVVGIIAAGVAIGINIANGPKKRPPPGPPPIPPRPE